MRRVLYIFTMTVIFSSFALADIRLPDTPKPTPAPRELKSIDTNLTIRIDKNAKEARLIIPKSQIKQLRAELEQLENEQDTTATAATGFTRTQTIISGMFMSLAMLFGGIWFTRSRKISSKIGKATIAGAVLFLSASVATIAFGNAGPPFETRSITSKLFSPLMNSYKYGSGKIKLETATDNSTNVTLIVPETKDDKPNNGE